MKWADMVYIWIGNTVIGGLAGALLGFGLGGLWIPRDAHVAVTGSGQYSVADQVRFNIAHFLSYGCLAGTIVTCFMIQAMAMMGSKRPRFYFEPDPELEGEINADR